MSDRFTDEDKKLIDVLCDDLYIMELDWIFKPPTKISRGKLRPRSGSEMLVEAQRLQKIGQHNLPVETEDRKSLADIAFEIRNRIPGEYLARILVMRAVYLKDEILASSGAGQ